jgi:hypothetical protein
VGEKLGEIAHNAHGGHYRLAGGFWQEPMILLHRFLADYDMAMLRVLARTRGVALTTNSQTEAADQLAIALLEPLSVRVALAQLSPPARDALDDLVAAGGQMRATRFARRYGQVRPSGPGRLEREEPWRNPANVAEELVYLGLIFHGFHKDEAGPGEFVFVPPDLMEQLPPPSIEPPAFRIKAVAAPDRPVDGGLALAQDLFVYLAYLQTHDVQPYADGRLGRNDEAALRARLTNRDGRRWAFLRHLCGQLAFAGLRERLLRVESGPARRWLRDSPAKRLLALQEAWRDDASWNDLCAVPALDCDQDTDWYRRFDPVGTRRKILGFLAKCPQGEWWSLVSFVKAIKAVDPDFQRPDGDYRSWYIRDAASGEYLSGFESWELVEGRFIEDLLTHTLCWLGVVAVGEGEDGRVCRVTGPGARLIGWASDELQAPAPTPIVVDADFRVEVPDPASLYVRFQLERFAKYESESPCRYRLTVGGLARALDRDIRVDQVLAFLHESSELPIPANVVGQLRLWAGRFGQVKVEELALVTVKEERVLKELSVLPETRTLIARVLSPTKALVHKRHLPRFKKELRALGYLPPEADG